MLVLSPDKKIIKGDQLRVVDFFCGCGGASEGLREAGLSITLGIDFDEKAGESYRLNFPEAAFISHDIRQIDTQEVVDALDKGGRGPLLLAACAPCQPFSPQNKHKNKDDPRRSLLSEVHRFVLELKPDYILLENVPGIQNIKIESKGPLSEFTELLNNQGYEYVKFVAHSDRYGVPQKRKRMVLIASKFGKIDIPIETHGDGLLPFTCVRDFIGGYPAIGAGEVDPADSIHAAARITDLNLERIKSTPEGGDRRNWPYKLINDCHKDYTGYTDTYGRMKWDSLAPTLTTKCNSYSNGRFGHPDIKQNRAISIREASRLQTFPPDYKFSGGICSMARQVGNAVPCELARQFGLAILEHYKNAQYGSYNGKNTD